MEWPRTYEDVGEEIQRAWANTIEPLVCLRDRPGLMKSGSYAVIERIRASIQRKLLQDHR
jgi:hypothetical protein